MDCTIIRQITGTELALHDPDGRDVGRLKLTDTSVLNIVVGLLEEGGRPIWDHPRVRAQCAAVLEHVPAGGDAADVKPAGDPVKAYRLLRHVRNVLNATDNEHEDFLDSGADAIDMLWEIEPDVKAFVREAAPARIQSSYAINGVRTDWHEPDHDSEYGTLDEMRVRLGELVDEFVGKTDADEDFRIVDAAGNPVENKGERA